MTDDDTASRRAFLGSAAAASLALAGCTDLRQRIANFDAPAAPDDSSRSADAWGFEDFEPWQAHNDTTLEADTESKVEGSQSAHIEGANGSLTRRFTRPLDLSNRDITFALRVEKPRPVNVRVFLTDTNGNETRLMQAIYPNHPREWVRVSPSIDQANADLGKISSLLISPTGSETKRYWLDDMRFPKRPSGGGARVLFTFDLATRDVYETAFPAMEEHGFKGCVAVPTDRIGDEDRLSADELGELRDAGWDIASASNDISSLYGQSRDIQTKRVERAVTTLSDMGLGEPRVFSYPRGELDTNTLEVVREHHDIGFLSFRDSEAGLSQRSVPAPHFFNRSQPSSVDAAKNQIGPAVGYGGVYAMYWWVLEDSKGKTSPSEFRAICEYVADQDNVSVVTPTKLLD